MATIKKPIKKAQNGAVAKDKTSVNKSKLKGFIKKSPTYKYADAVTTPTKKDSAEYKKGFDYGKNKPKNTLQGIFESPAWSVGNLEGRNDKRPLKKVSLKKGGTVKAKDGKWIQKAINPAHKGYCTPETKATCTPRRKALAHTLRKIAKSKKKK